MIRFFADESDISGGKIQLNAEDAAHIRSLRLRPSEFFIVCDGNGSDHICRLGGAENPESGTSVSKSAGKSAVAEIIETRPSLGEPNIRCSVYIAFAKGERLDYAVQKSVELGACEIILFPSERCVSLPGDISKKTARFRRIALETAKQCGRGRVPAVSAEDSFETAVRKAAGADIPLIFYECEDKLHLKEALERRIPQSGTPGTQFGPESKQPLSALEYPLSISIVTGPEGGFEPREAELAQSAGMLRVTLGPRILRCETAPAAALAAIMFHTGNF